VPNEAAEYRGYKMTIPLTLPPLLRLDRHPDHLLVLLLQGPNLRGLHHLDPLEDQERGAALLAEAALYIA